MRWYLDPGQPVTAAMPGYLTHASLMAGVIFPPVAEADSWTELEGICSARSLKLALLCTTQGQRGHSCKPALLFKLTTRYGARLEDNMPTLYVEHQG